jgi:uncharacterized protein
MKRKKGELEIGCVIGPNGKPDLLQKVNINAEGMLSHCAILGQSGSGKSNGMGRILEELVSNTLAKIVILDPNSDFVVLGDIVKRKDRHFNFIWSKVNITVISNRTKDELSIKSGNTTISPFYICWDDLSFSQKCLFLGITVEHNSDEISTLRTIDEIVTHNKSLVAINKQFTLSVLVQCVQTVIETLESKSPSHPGIQIPTDFQLAFINKRALFSLQTRLLDIWQSDIWGFAGKGSPIQETVKKYVTCNENRPCVLVIDLPSVPRQQDRLMVCHIIMECLWESAQLLWTEAVASTENGDKRVPVFLVIDEAHNIAPASTGKGFSSTVSESILKIASEGRKYALSLVVATQRLSRINLGLLSELDNLILFRIKNTTELEILSQLFGISKRHQMRKIPEFTQGDALLFGKITQSATHVHFFERRTKPGGKNISRYWLRPRT